MARLHNAKLEVLEMQSRPLWETKKESVQVEIVSATDKNYFGRLKRSGNIRTVMVSTKWHQTLSFLLPHYYPITSNNCTRLISTSEHSNKHVDCENDTVLGLTKLVPLYPEWLTNGIPPERITRNYSIQQETPLTFIHVMPDVYVHQHGDVYVGSVKIIPWRCKPEKSLRSRSIQRDTLLSAPLYDEVFTISQYWGEYFFHATLENLPRLAPYLEYLKRFPHIRIHAAMRHPFLPLLGLGRKRIIIGHIRAKLLYMPAGVPCGMPTIFPTQMLSFHLRRGLMPMERNVIVLIRKSRRRWFKHHESILQMLEEVSAPEGYILKEYRDDPVPGINTTRELFSRAFLVVAPHGAGEANLVFSQPGTVVIEGLCYERPNKINLCYKETCERLALRYHGLLFEKDCFDITVDDVKTSVLDVLEVKRQGLL